MSAPSVAQFAGYRVEAVAGRGGMGVVYKATQLGLDRSVALKVIAAGRLGDPRVRERFLHESRAAAAIEHPNVIPIHDYGEHDGQAYIAMRFVDGDDLTSAWPPPGRLHRRRPRRSCSRSPRRSTPRTTPGSSTATSSPRTSCSAGTIRSTSATSVSRAMRSPRAGSRRRGLGGTIDFIAPEQIRGERLDRRASTSTRWAASCASRWRAETRTRGRKPTRRGCGRTSTRRLRSPRGWCPACRRRSTRSSATPSRRTPASARLPRASWGWPRSTLRPARAHGARAALRRRRRRTRATAVTRPDGRGRRVDPPPDRSRGDRPRGRRRRRGRRGRSSPAARESP